MGLKSAFPFRCKRRGCHTYLGFKAEAEREAFVLDHSKRNCPSVGHHTTYGRSASQVILESMWEDADEALKDFMENQANDYLKGTLVGMSAMIFLASKPYYDNVDEVKRELMARMKYKAEHGSLEGHVTPGARNITLFPEEPIVTYPAQGGYTNDPAFADSPPVGFPVRRVEAARGARTGARPTFGPDKDPTVAADMRATDGSRVPLGGVTSAPTGPPRPSPSRPTRTPAAPRRAQAKQFTPEEAEKIRAGHTGGFPLDLLAMTYKCTEADIKSLLDNRGG